VLNVRKNLKNNQILDLFVALGFYVGLRFFHERMSQVLPVFENRGVSFGVELGIWGWIIGFGLLMFLVVKWGKYFGARLMIFGAIGNLVDRLVLGVVRDYWNFFGIWINNIYDWVIVLGGILLIIELWRKSSK
jgi:lipoprotein signal peptidase